MSGECSLCAEPAATEAIGTYDGVFGIEETVPLALCRRHADALRDELVIPRSPSRKDDARPHEPTYAHRLDGDERGPSTILPPEWNERFSATRPPSGSPVRPETSRH